MGAKLRISLSPEIISIVVSIRVDKIYDKRVVWDRGFTDRDSESYQTLAYEANRAVSESSFESLNLEHERRFYVILCVS